jgi:hypothetical protein
MNILWKSALALTTAAICFMIFETACATHTESERGQVISKGHDPAHETHSCVLVGKVIVPTTNHVPESWRVDVSCNGGDYSFAIDAEQYKRLSEKQYVGVSFTIGNYTGAIYGEALNLP